MSKFVEVLAIMFRVPDLGKKVLITLMILALGGLGLFMLRPGVNSLPFILLMTDLMLAAVAFILFVEHKELTRRMCLRKAARQHARVRGAHN